MISGMIYSQKMFYGLYGFVLVLLLVMIAGFLWPVSDFEKINVRKLRLKNFKVSEKRTFHMPPVPVFNIFDREGKDWKKPVKKKSPQKSSSVTFNEESIKGIIKWPSLSGVLTESGFVAVGDQLDGWKLVQVDDGNAIFESQGRRIVVSMNKQREKRKRQFKNMGFPFLN